MSLLSSFYHDLETFNDDLTNKPSSYNSDTNIFFQEWRLSFSFVYL